MNVEREREKFFLCLAHAWVCVSLWSSTAKAEVGLWRSRKKRSAATEIENSTTHRQKDVQTDLNTVWQSKGKLNKSKRSANGGFLFGICGSDRQRTALNLSTATVESPAGGWWSLPGHKTRNDQDNLSADLQSLKSDSGPGTWADQSAWQFSNNVHTHTYTDNIDEQVRQVANDWFSWKLSPAVKQSQQKFAYTRQARQHMRAVCSGVCVLCCKPMQSTLQIREILQKVCQMEMYLCCNNNGEEEE